MTETKLGPYNIVEEIGKGGMATVYRAYQPSMDRFVAVKVMLPAVIEDETMRERFQREARLIARLEHPHILPIYDFDGTHDPPYIVMRYLEGGTLKDVLTSRQLPFDEICFLLRQIGPALDYAHRQGVVHRDIKPSNIMIDREGNAFVMDFGIARLTGIKAPGGSITGTGTAVGTPDYMSPEQVMGAEGIDFRADVYSLGVMLFQMIVGQLPFDNDSSMVTMLMHLRDPVPSAYVLNPEIPPELDLVFQRAMAKEPVDRFQSVNAFTAAVQDLLGSAVAGTPTQLKLAARESMSLRSDRLAKDGRVSKGAVSGATPSEENKTVTAVYADAAEYAEIVDLSSGPEAARRAVRGLWGAATRIVEDNGGLVFNQTERDMLALWGSESAREDDAERAVHAALVVRDAVRDHAAGLIQEDEPLPIRIGVNTGLALLSLSAQTGTHTASGATISLASRLADNADGRVLITHDTFRQVQGVFDVEPEASIRVRRLGGPDLLGTYQVKAVKPRAFRLKPRGIEGVDTRLIGRRAELEQLQKAFFNAVEDSETQMVTVVGDPGLGKSRLLYEFATWAELRPEPYYIFRVRATPATTSRPYALWRDLLSFRFEILDNDSPVVVCEKMEAGVAALIGPNDELAHLMGYLAGFDFSHSHVISGEPQAVGDRARVAVRRFFNRLTEEDPVVLQLDDLHYADEASLDMLMEVISADSNRPLLIVATTRPSIYQRRPAWGSGQDFHSRVDLRPLDKRDSRDLVAEILQKVDRLPRNLRDLLVERAEGNPYYMEELVKMLIDDRVIQKLDEDRWTVEASRLERLRVPRTLAGLLQARFDSLLYPEKLTLQRAAVVGRIFFDTALVALDEADEAHIDDLSRVLQSLVDREFIHPRETSAFGGSREYIFAQAMLRDLILETLLERQVTTYNRASAEWLAAQSGERVGEYDALIAEHYEAAGELILAAQYFGAAAGAAVSRGALDEGIRLGEHGLELVDREENPAEHLALQQNLAATYGWKGAYRSAYGHLEPALETARQLGNRPAEANVLAQLGRVAGLWQGDFDAGRDYLHQALRIARELDDRPGLVFILRQLGNLVTTIDDYTEARLYLQESQELARELENFSDVANALNSLGEGSRMGGDYEAAQAYYEEALTILEEHDDPSIRALVTTNLAFMYLDRGDHEAARQAAERALQLASEIGTLYLIAGCLRAVGGASVGLGKFEAGRWHLDEALRMYWAMGNMPEVLICIPYFARLQAQDGDQDGALEWLGMALYHPSLNPEGRLQTERALAEIGRGLPQDQLEALLLRGAELDLDLALEEILGSGDIQGQ